MYLIISEFCFIFPVSIVSDLQVLRPRVTSEDIFEEKMLLARQEIE